MYKDMFGKTRQKVGLHCHSTMSDGKKTPEEVAEIYKSAGYDALAITDHWYYNDIPEISGLRIISGAEFDIGGKDARCGIYHILSLFARKNPKPDRADDAQTIIDKIHAAGGLAVLAHPAWSLNTPEMMLALDGIDATEIYNTVSAVNYNFRPDSSLIIDTAAYMGGIYPLLATDDSHGYTGADNCVSYIMAECESNEPEEIKRAIVEKRFYATQGPELHLSREGDNFIVNCSPVEHIYFASNTSICKRATHGEALTYAEYTPVDSDCFVRAFVIDADGKQAWSNIIRV
ncbi:MAG: PHP domain-containing protein [Clostridia bacterium]|nr:PHP domain-containing protein [Clostridia bacterium]